MKLYNLNTDTIGKYRVIEDVTGTFYVDKLSEAERNALGYYNIIYESPPDKRYYDAVQVKGLVADKYMITYTATEKPLYDVQTRMLRDLRVVSEDKASRPIVDTLLGYSVYGGQLDIIELQDAKNNAEQVIIDVNNDEQSVDGVAYVAIADAVRLSRDTLRATAKTKVSEVKALTTVDECIEYEHEPYDYTVTQEDVDNDPSGELVLGEIIVRYINNITGW